MSAAGYDEDIFGPAPGATPAGSPSASAAPAFDPDVFGEPPVPRVEVRGTADSTEPAPRPPVSRLDRFIRGALDPISGGAQLLTNALPAGIVKTGDRLNNYLADKTGMFPRLPEGGVDQQVREQESAYQAARGPDAGSFDPMRVLGNVLSPANLAMAARAPQAATMLGRVGIGAGLGASSAAMNPVTDSGDFATEKAKQMGIGAAFGGGLPLLTAAAGRVVSPAASQNPQLDLLRSAGVQPTIGQTLGGLANRIEEKATSIPLMGDAIGAARSRAQQQFNTAAINDALQPLGAKVSGAGHDAVSQAHGIVSDAYDSARAQLGHVQFDPQWQQDFGQLQQMAQGLTPSFQRQFNKAANDFVLNRAPTGVMTADTFKRADSDLATVALKYQGAPQAAAKEFGDSVAQLRDLLNQQAYRTNPAAATAKNAADAAFARLVRVENAANRGINTAGEFTPGQFNMAVRATDTSARDNLSAQGKALMQNLGNAGQQVLGNRVPNSGTADRAMLGVGALASGAYNPAIPAALIGGAALYTPPAQSLLRAAVASRPQSAQAVREAMLKASPLLLPGAAQVGLGLLK